MCLKITYTQIHMHKHASLFKRVGTRIVYIGCVESCVNVVFLFGGEGLYYRTALRRVHNVSAVGERYVQMVSKQQNYIMYNVQETVNKKENCRW